MAARLATWRPTRPTVARCSEAPAPPCSARWVDLLERRLVAEGVSNGAAIRLASFAVAAYEGSTMMARADKDTAVIDATGHVVAVLQNGKHAPSTRRVADE